MYTPGFLKEFIVKHSIDGLEKPIANLQIADISCGCGAFLFTAANKLHNEYQIPFAALLRNNLFGLDISPVSTTRARILLSLLALSNGEDEEDFLCNIYTGNALSFDWKSSNAAVAANRGFDVIVGNPPYVRAKNLDEESKILLPKWKVSQSGNPDLYITFFEIGLQSLNEHGRLGYITVNSFFKSVNARNLREYFKAKQASISIIDFGHEKLFTGKSAYTCICLINPGQSDSIKFKREKSISLVSTGLAGFSTIPYGTLDAQKGWLLSNDAIIQNINKIENAGTPLGNAYKIKNGIATLSNSIFIFKPIGETKYDFILSINGTKYPIEKAICRDIIKPNILKTEGDIPRLKEQVIYPYTNGISPLTIMKEDYLAKKFPFTYRYLLDHKDLLAERDKGEGDYSAWYAFGRTQALNDKGYKLMFPYMAKEPHFVVSDQKDLMIYCGYAIFHESLTELKILKRILESSVFKFYMAHTSKPYSAGYFSYAKNYVKGFGVIDLNDKEKHFLSNGATKKEIDEFLIKKYQLLL